MKNPIEDCGPAYYIDMGKGNIYRQRKYAEKSTDNPVFLYEEIIIFLCKFIIENLSES